MITLVPVGGLANRMRAIDSAIALAQDTHHELRIIWFKDQGLNCKFCELFQPIMLPGVSVREAGPSDHLLHDRPRKKNFYLPSFFLNTQYDAHIYEKEANDLFYQQFDFKKWAESAKILQLLCISGAFIPIINLCSNLLISKGKSNIYMWNTIGLVIFQLFVMLLCHPYGIHTMIVIYVAININWLLIWHHFVQKEICYSLANLMKDLFPFLCITLGIIFICHLCIPDHINIYLQLICKVGMVSFLYILIMWRSGSATFKESINYLIKKKKI